MLSTYYPGGQASALEICGDEKFTAAYMDQQVVLLDTAKASGKPAVLPSDGGTSGDGRCSAMAAAAH
jgi:hypothetical protein